MNPAPRNRIKRHVRVRAGDLVPHELNPRLHPESQRRALEALYRAIGFARSLLAYELPDGRLKLIDGHLRASLDPEQEVEVEVLNVNDAEARALLLSIDPLTQLADYDVASLDELRRQTPTESEALADLWQSIARSGAAVEEALRNSRRSAREEKALPEQYLILVECAGEQEQTALLRRFKQQGLKCKALIS
jgi:hypothetical protein